MKKKMRSTIINAISWPLSWKGRPRFRPDLKLTAMLVHVSGTEHALKNSSPNVPFDSSDECCNPGCFDTDSNSFLSFADSAVQTFYRRSDGLVTALYALKEALPGVRLLAGCMHSQVIVVSAALLAVLVISTRSLAQMPSERVTSAATQSSTNHNSAVRDGRGTSIGSNQTVKTSGAYRADQVEQAYALRLGQLESLSGSDGTFDVKDYGATGTGIYGGHDDSPAIQNAIDAACLSNNVNDGQVSATTGLIPAGSYMMTYPWWVNCAGLSWLGDGTLASVFSPVYDFGPTGVFAPKAYPGVPLAAPLVSGPGNSFDFTQDRASAPFIKLSEWRGVLGAAGTCTGMILNGCANLTVEYFVNYATDADGATVSSSSEESISKGQASAFYSGIGPGRWLDRILLSATGSITLNPADAIITGASYYHALTYNGAAVRQYSCTPGATSVSPIAQASAIGTIVQGPTEEVTIGSQMMNWPNGAGNQSATNGKVYSIRVSNIDRWPSGTIATCPSSAFAADSNTLILTDGEQAPGGAPVYKAYDDGLVSGGYGIGWLFGYSENRIQAGNYEISQNGMQSIGIFGPADNSGIIYVGGHDSIFDGLEFRGMEVGVETYQLAYENSFSNLFVNGAPGRYGISDTGGGINSWSGMIKVSNFWADEVANSGTFSGIRNIEGNNGASRYGFVQNNLPGYNPAESTVTDKIDDSEDGGNPQTPDLVLNNPDSGIAILNEFGGNDQATNTSPAAILDSGGELNYFGTAIESNGGSATEVVHCTGSPPGIVNFEAATLIGFGSAPLSSTCNVTITPPTAVPTATATPTATVAVTRTATATGTVTVTPSTTTTVSPTPTTVRTPATSPTPTATPTLTATVTATPTGTFTPTPMPTVSAPLVVSPSSESFAATVGRRSGAKITVAHNAGTVPILLLDARVTGDFVLSNRCGGTLKARKRCAYAVVFVPTAIGMRTGLLTINNNGSTGPQTVKLSGTGHRRTGSERE